MKTVKDLLENKGDNIYSVTPKSTVLDAITLMAEKSIGSVLVLEDSKLKGILTERDYMGKVILKNRSSRNTPVEDIMQSSVLCVQTDNTVDECMALMTEKRIRHLPAFTGDQLVGLISIGDIVKEVISGQQVMIEQLENYIYG